MARVLCLLAGSGCPPNEARMMACRNGWALVAALLVMAAASAAALAGDAGQYTFTVLKDGDPVGHHRFAFERDGDRIGIREATDIDVRFATIPVYSFEHEGRQVWENDRVLRIDATTNDNGEELDITVRPDGRGGYVRTVNGRVDEFDRSKQVLAFWNKDIISHQDFFSVVEDKVLKVSFKFVGREKITLAGKQVEVDHYRMVGDEERDLWFDQAGRIAKVEFSRRGSEIAYVRDQVAPLPASSCSPAC
jgi:Family of unknown function (DUF6134)